MEQDLFVYQVAWEHRHLVHVQDRSRHMVCRNPALDFMSRCFDTRRDQAVRMQPVWTVADYSNLLKLAETRAEDRALISVVSTCPSQMSCERLTHVAAGT